VAELGLEYLKAVAAPSANNPFFLCLGFHRPHVDYTVPALTSHTVPAFAFNSIDQTTISNAIEDKSGPWYINRIPASTKPSQSVNGIPTLTMREPDSRKVIPISEVEEGKIWYTAAVDWIDSCIGQILTALDTSYAANSAHGLANGREHGAFGKSTPFEETSRIPLMIRIPWMSQRLQEMRTGSLFGSVDLISTTLGLLE